MKKILVSLVLVGILSPVLLEAKTYATINGKAITEKDFESIKEEFPGFDFEKLSTQEQQTIINQLIEERLVVNAAKAEKLDTTKDFTNKLEIFKKRLLLDTWMQKQAQTIQMPTPSEEQLRQIYKENESRFIDQEGKARHIVVESENEAKEIVTALNKVRGKIEPKFIDLANQKTIDPVGKQQQNGGDLGTFHRARMVPEFSKAAFDLKPGTYTKTPVKTQFGYHVIYLESKTEPKVIPYDQAKQIILQEMQMQAFNQAIGIKIQELRSKAKIEIAK
ncbi:MAG: peptidyl-prolyl cis-trans isomerase [Helicobacter sp.]|uniref:peptidylprolyl isomerase n=1 Tax=Helicobacter sp. 10-6591 TaxID=2004998 RepID=UPI000DCE6120|nr:peptidyl-prolyl cis-trans isomerase [Helicobacter sp. 10-6591]MCI6217905.1 peptidyl-prolyl cis-trans isomerase [Helicobacter sp.]MCI7484681.1 peptidyl-prolyl cis-trans isomerase [Helicobacter sp.]RAX55925.1 peptidylprolyl isomerase [Helicobacter sp. 10-6591]